MSSVGIVGGGLLGMSLAAQAHAARATGSRSSRRRRAPAAWPRPRGSATTPGTGSTTWSCCRTSTCASSWTSWGSATALHWKPTRTGFYIDGRAALALEHPGVPHLPRARAAGQGSPRRHDPVRLTHPGLAPLEAVLASDWLKRWSGHARLGAALAPAAAGQAGRQCRAWPAPRSSGPSSPGCTAPGARA